MNYLNSQTNLKGRVGNEPHFVEADEGRDAHFRLSLATNDYSFKDDSGEWQDRTTWHKVIAWGAKAEALNRQHEKGKLAKGAQLQLAGQYRNNNYTDKEGTDRYEMVFHVGGFEVLQAPPSK